MFAVGVDFGFGHVRVAVCDLRAKVLAQGQIELGAGYSPAQGIPASQRLVEETILKSGVPRDRIVGAGVAIPGPVDSANQRVVESAIHPGWGGTRDADFAAAFGLPAYLENDANLAALGEHTWGAGRDFATTLTVKMHSGVGAGVIVNGALITGHRGGAGEIGHVTIDPLGALCRCGKRGCLDTFAAIPAVLRAAEASYPGLDFATLLTMIHSGDPGARRVLADAASMVGQVVGSIDLLLAPEAIIVVGAMARAGDAVLEPMRESLHHQQLPGVARDVKVSVGELGDLHTALGGVALAMRQNGWIGRTALAGTT